MSEIDFQSQRNPNFSFGGTENNSKMIKKYIIIYFSSDMKHMLQSVKGLYFFQVEQKHQGLYYTLNN